MGIDSAGESTDIVLGAVKELEVLSQGVVENLSAVFMRQCLGFG